MTNAPCRILLLLLPLLACGGDDARPRPEVAEAMEAPVGRDEWWKAATVGTGDLERVLAPRELRALVAHARDIGFDRDDAWWGPKARWIWERVLSVDPEDLEANEGLGRRTLQSIEGFSALWERMLLADPTDEITALLDQYDPWVQDERPHFLTRDEYEVLRARLRNIEAHLGKVDADPGYAAIQSALRRVRSSFHSDYPYIHVQFGPFVVFYTARDLHRIEEEEGGAEDVRIRTREEYYRRKLEKWRPVYEGLLADLQELYPGLWKAHGVGPRTLFLQWVFDDAEWYRDFVERRGKEDSIRPYREGFFDRATGWAYLNAGTGADEGELPEGEAEQREQSGPPEPLMETAAFLAAQQILRTWARNPRDPMDNFLDYSEAFWLKEGWPAFLASRRVGTSRVGPVLRLPWEFPALITVVERRSRFEQRYYLVDNPDDETSLSHVPDTGFTDLAWLLVRHLNTDEMRPRFVRYLRSQIGSVRRGVDHFEECFDIIGPKDWTALQKAVYGSIPKD